MRTPARKTRGSAAKKIASDWNEDEDGTSEKAKDKEAEKAEGLTDKATKEGQKDKESADKNVENPETIEDIMSFINDAGTPTETTTPSGRPKRSVRSDKV